MILSVRDSWYTASKANDTKCSSQFTYSEYLERSHITFITEALEDDRQQIDLDVPRTGVSIYQYILDRPLPDNDDDIDMYLVEPFFPIVQNILLAYCVRNPTVGYIQGHADVVCFLLGSITTTKDGAEREEKTFWLYTSCIESLFPNDFFSRQPKLHGLQVDQRVYFHLMTQNLFSKYKLLSNIENLSLTTSLLACKWFVSIWIDLLPFDMVIFIWDMMIKHENGRIIHLALALHYVETVMKSMPNDRETMDASELYQIIIKKSRSTSYSASELNGIITKTIKDYKLTNSGIEDLRITLRVTTSLRRVELQYLSKQTHFSLEELERLYNEYAFLHLRLQTNGKNNERCNAGRQVLEDIFARECTSWSVELYERLYHCIRPDMDGNVPFGNLMQFLSIAVYGTLKEKSLFVFHLADPLDYGVLDKNGVKILTDIMCCLMSNHIGQPNGGNNTETNAHLLKHSIQEKIAELETTTLAKRDGITQDVFLSAIENDPDLILRMGISSWTRSIARENGTDNLKQSCAEKPVVTLLSEDLTMDFYANGKKNYLKMEEKYSYFEKDESSPLNVSNPALIANNENNKFSYHKFWCHCIIC